MAIPVAGAGFQSADTRSSPRVAIVNETFVKLFAGSREAIGQTLRTSEEPNYPSTTYEIVGVIPDTQYNDLRGEKRPMVFAPDTQHPSPGPFAMLMIHANVPPEVAIARVREQVARRYPDASQSSQSSSRVSATDSSASVCWRCWRAFSACSRSL
jgi:hypothetical protein